VMVTIASWAIGSGWWLTYYFWIYNDESIFFSCYYLHFFLACFALLFSNMKFFSVFAGWSYISWIALSPKFSEVDRLSQWRWPQGSCLWVHASRKCGVHLFSSNSYPILDRLLLGFLKFLVTLS
jgi:hypothetical protein